MSFNLKHRHAGCSDKGRGNTQRLILIFKSLWWRAMICRLSGLDLMVPRRTSSWLPTEDAKKQRAGTSPLHQAVSHQVAEQSTAGPRQGSVGHKWPHFSRGSLTSKTFPKKMPILSKGMDWRWGRFTLVSKWRSWEKGIKVNKWLPVGH